MNFRTFNQLIQLNKDFYDKVGSDFSKTRQTSWNGWSKVAEFINNQNYKKRFKVLDLGCGNGRFYDFLKSNFKYEFDYIGVDSSEILLSEAREKYPEGKFIENDVILDINNIEDSFDLIFAFGITHHIPSFEYRKTWFNLLASHLSQDGVLIVTFWNFPSDNKRFHSKIKNHSMDLDIEDGDYLLGWSDTKNIYRYCHFFTPDEIQTIVESKYIEIGTFQSDGKTSDLNQYKILKKK